MTFDNNMCMSISHAHNHAKMIVQENRGLKVLIEATKAFLDNPGILSELCGTLSRLAVRNELCQEVVDLGGLSILVSLLSDCSDHQKLLKQLLSNDDVKDTIVHAGGMGSIVAAMTWHQDSPQVCEQSCTAQSILALRKPNNSRIIVEGGGVVAALQAMKAHPQEAGMQKQVCIRAFSKPFLDLGAEALVTKAQSNHRNCEDMAKAALRDLELWTGQRGHLAP
uniref:Armadillo repeat containing 6 n=1 Tax=Saimiri boliviensis boliviensis TaxID=39432 RepID=A0A2K6SPE8_SAIBB